MTDFDVVDALAGFAEDLKSEAAFAERLHAAVVKMKQERDAAREEVERLTECNDAMREPMRKLRDVMGMPAQGEGYVVDSIIEDRARLQRLVWDYDSRFSLLSKIARGVEEKVGRYLEYHGPSCDEHEDEPDDFCATCRMDTAANDAISELKFWSRT